MHTSDVQIFASTQAALEEICQTLEAQYGDRVYLERGPARHGEWQAQGTIRLLPNVSSIPRHRQHRNQRIIIS